MIRYILRIACFLCLLPAVVVAQPTIVNLQSEHKVIDSTFEIQYIVTNTRIPGYLDVHVRFTVEDSVPSGRYLEDSLFMVETESNSITYETSNSRANTTPMEKQKVVPKRFDVVTILMDISSSMWQQVGGKEVYMDSAKAIVEKLLDNLAAPYAAKIYNFDEILYERTIDGPTSFRNATKPATARYTHLYENVATAIDRMAGAEGRKILIVVGDGENDHNRNLPEKTTRAELLEKLKNLDTSYVIYPINLGRTTYRENVEELVRYTANKTDEVTYGMASASLTREVKDLKRWPVTHTILVKSTLYPHDGRVRQIEARLGKLRSVKDYRLGGLFNPWNEQSSWQLDAFVGGILIVLLFVIFAIYIPRRHWADFRKKYVKHYWQVKQEGIRRYDPLTKFPFRDEDEVVVKCEHMTSLETWQFEGRRGGKDGGNRKRKNRCIYYPNKCEGGHSPGGSTDFFAQIGIFRPLFWVFLASVGAFAGWCLWSLFEINKKVYWNATLDKFAATDFVQSRWGLKGIDAPLEDSIRVAREGVLNPFFEQLVLAGILSALIVFLIAISAEIAQARGGFTGWTIVRGIFRSMLRGFIAGIMGILILAGFGYLQAFVFLHHPYLPGLLTMLLLGVVLGRVLTVRSGIRAIRGTLAGLAAGFVAFHIYFLPMIIFHARGYEGPKMIAFIVFGAILAMVVSEGSPALEASEMEIWTQRKRYGKIHITDLLRKNEDVTIGRGPTATIRMKVRHTPAHNAPGNVTQTFASLLLRNEVVYLQPEVFTEVNGEAVAPNERVALFHGDKISFEHRSPSHLTYTEHRRGVHPRWRYRNRRNRKAKRAEARGTAEVSNAGDTV
jgi:hypothetical protein